MHNLFYDTKEWRTLRRDILNADKRECQLCKSAGTYTKATHVHHIKHVDKYPELALSKTYIDKDGNERRNLMSVCRDCHENKCHPERLRWNKKTEITEERWD